MNWNWTLIVVGALMVLLELVLGGFAGFDLVLLGSSIVVGGAVGLAAGSVTTGFVTATLLCALYIAIGRRWIRKRLKRPGISTNVDALIGQKALVTTPISEHAPGQVRLRDEVWRARPSPGQGAALEAGAEVTVESVEGVTLFVRR